jgi:hypothetical protein
MSAVVNRDCAPWDGAAFTVSIPATGGVVEISIWEAPDIRGPRRFTFLALDQNSGSAFFRTGDGTSEALSGEVTLQGVSTDSPVAGRMTLTSAGGRLFAGNFHAEWGTQLAYCG